MKDLCVAPILLTCPSGQVPNNDFSTCIDEIKNCATYEDGDESKCLACNSHSLAPTENKKYCVEKISNCKTYENQKTSQCKECNNNLLVSQLKNQCVTKLLDNCGEYLIKDSKETCTKCLSSYYFKNVLDSENAKEALDKEETQKEILYFLTQNSQAQDILTSISTENKQILTMKTVINLAINLGVSSTRKSKIKRINSADSFNTIFEPLQVTTSNASTQMNTLFTTLKSAISKNCLSCYTTSGEYISGDECQLCNMFCSSCHRYSYCTACWKGFALSNDQCQVQAQSQLDILENNSTIIEKSQSITSIDALKSTTTAIIDLFSNYGKITNSYTNNAKSVSMTKEETEKLQTLKKSVTYDYFQSLNKQLLNETLATSQQLEVVKSLDDVTNGLDLSKNAQMLVVDNIAKLKNMNEKTFQYTLNLYSTILTKNKEENSTNIDIALATPMIAKIKAEKENMIQNKKSFGSFTNENFHFDQYRIDKNNLNYALSSTIKSTATFTNETIEQIQNLTETINISSKNPYLYYIIETYINNTFTEDKVNYTQLGSSQLSQIMRVNFYYVDENDETNTLEIKDVEPIKLYLSSLSQANFTLDSNENYTCLFYSNGEWVNKGVTFGGSFDNDTAYCQTTHFTDFMIVKAEQQAINVNDDDDDDDDWILPTILSICLIAFLVLVMIFRCYCIKNKKNLNQKKADQKPETEQNLQDQNQYV